MDRYERVLRDIKGKTEAGLLSWVPESPHRYNSVVFNPDRVIRLFRADYTLGDSDYRLVFVERKRSEHDEYGDPVETLEIELLVLDAAENLVFPLTEGYVDREDLLTLASAIAEANDGARRFFDAFERVQQL
ncbi:MAG TPA: hypothetical protein VF170_19025 [Planctomycetaceae bacterium]